MEPWLNQDDLIRYIGEQEVPASFNTGKLKATLREVIEGWLTELVGETMVSEYYGYFNSIQRIQFSYESYAEIPDVDDQGNPIEKITLDQYTTGGLIAKFLSYAVWAVYCKKANAVNTDTGYVTKLNQDSDPISDRQRTELSSYYTGLAERVALKLSKLKKADEVCSDGSGYSGRPTIRKAQPRSPSRLGN